MVHNVYWKESNSILETGLEIVFSSFSFCVEYPFFLWDFRVWFFLQDFGIKNHRDFALILHLYLTSCIINFGASYNNINKKTLQICVQINSKLSDKQLVFFHVLWTLRALYHATGDNLSKNLSGCPSFLLCMSKIIHKLQEILKTVLFTVLDSTLSAFFKYLHILSNVTPRPTAMKSSVLKECE